MDYIKIKNYLLRSFKFKWWLALMGVSFIFTYSSFDENHNKGGDRGESFNGRIDTLIPEGFVLLPVELSNREALDGFLQSSGVVDLYVSMDSNLRARKVAGGVKIIRSPQNPDQLAVLVSETKARFLIKRGSLFYAIIQNPKKKGEGVYPLEVTPKRKIIIENLLPSLPVE